ncbi:MAG: octaprenyl-diphosphate synthase, partial [Mariprofundaceae bacterium]|nr:octaprenyl-diphosphate synthase [Mariprofundaceae bacterium]
YAEGEREAVRDRVQAAGGVQRCLDAAAEYAERAKACLSESGDAATRQLMADLADFSARRTH